MKLEIIFLGLVAIYNYFYKSLKSALLYTVFFALLCLARNSVFVVSLQTFSFNPIYLGVIVFSLFLLIAHEHNDNANSIVAVFVLLCLYIVLTNINVLNVFSINFNKYAFFFGVIVALIPKSNGYISLLFFILVAEIYNILVVSKLIGYVGVFTLDTMIIGCWLVNIIKFIYKNKMLGVGSVY